MFTNFEYFGALSIQRLYYQHSMLTIGGSYWLNFPEIGVWYNRANSR